MADVMTSPWPATWPKSKKAYSKAYLSNDSVKMILRLHKVEAQLRKEIAAEQIYHWTPAQIRARFGT